MSCRCKKPGTSVNPRRQGVCVKCGHKLDPAWVSSDQRMAEYFTELIHSMRQMPNENPDSDDFYSFRAEAEARERAGRDTFGFEYLVRENMPEAREEGADGGNYFYFDSLKTIREEGSDEEMDLVLEGMFFAYKLHQTARRLRAKRHGAPG